MLTVSYCKGPTDLVVSNLLPDGFTISFTPPLDNPAISFFTITVGGPGEQEVCRLEKTETPRWCDFHNLMPDTEYPVAVRCCLEGEGGCGEPLLGTAKTERRSKVQHFYTVEVEKSDSTNVPL